MARVTRAVVSGRCCVKEWEVIKVKSGYERAWKISSRGFGCAKGRAFQKTSGPKEQRERCRISDVSTHPSAGGFRRFGGEE